MQKENEIPIGIWQSTQRELSDWVSATKNNIILQDMRGTFADNMKAPIHRWFRFSAGFSYDLVEEAFRLYKVSKYFKVLDPFVGSGTTSICAKKLGIPSVGIEAHPLVAWIAKVKTSWDLDFSVLKKEIETILFDLGAYIKDTSGIDTENKPKLLHKCFTRAKLLELYAIKNYLTNITDENIRNLCILALISTLRKVSSAHTGWPYILPRIKKNNARKVFDTYNSQLRMMVSDLEMVVNKENRKIAADIHTADARELSKYVDDETIDFAFTSPPYLNNYDYADRTRLELYFLSPFKLNGETLDISSWRDITEHIRKKLIINVSHQAKEIGLKEGLQPDPEIADYVEEKLMEISEKLRKEKQFHGGHKAYDISVVAYFNDMFKTMKEVYRVMKLGGYYLLVLGDSAPYGVHVPTDIFLAKIALGVGFSKAKIGLLRKRGGKWLSAPKHRVPLRESMIILSK